MKLLRGNILILIIVSVVFFVSPSSAADKLRIGYGAPSVAMSVLWITKEGRIFEKNGLDVEVLYLESALVQRALIAGNIAFGEMTGSLMSAPRLQGADLVMVAGFLNKLLYRLIARPEIKDVQQLKGKKLGVATIRGSDHLVADELMLSKGFNPAGVQPIGVGDASMRYQAMIGGAIDVVAVATPQDLMLRQKGFTVLAGPPEVGVPGSGVFTSEKFLRENTLAHNFILDNKAETIQAMMRWLPQSLEVATHSYDIEMKVLTRDGLMTDNEIDTLIAKLGEKKRPMDEVRDFTLARQALKELESGK